MATLAKLKKEAKKHGATLEIDRGEGVQVDIDAPDGMEWLATGADCICECWYTDIPEMYDHLISMMNEGLTPTN